ncbi:Uncharacterised protein [Mycobacterium tuberculosis]|nr:Uncharacterised protein [Mycobacterium tuberculosis]
MSNGTSRRPASSRARPGSGWETTRDHACIAERSGAVSVSGPNGDIRE